MKKIIGVLSLALLIGCSSSGNRKNDTCNNSEWYGYVNICLPTIDGMKECRLHPRVQAFTQKYRESGPLLGYYLNDKIHQRIDSLGTFSFDNYFMLYGDYNRENYEATATDLPLMQQQLEQSLVGTNWQELGRQVEDVYNTLMIGQPAIIEKYSPCPDVLTMIVLMKYRQENGQESTVISAANCILVKKRLLNMAYYMAYDGGKTIDLLKERNDAAVQKLMQLNP
ncbi:MAG: hypothetical protein ACTTKI_05915 [Tannerella sp.]|uniref:hypothetical protein n=1 Tax=Tannerella sp. TaxID=2382127 RepID=UPI003FA221AF